MQILDLLGMYFDAAVLFVTSQTLLFRLALAITVVLPFSTQTLCYYIYIDSLLNFFFIAN